jgi:uncharacterized protein YndB with AHSA1/START domain
MISTKWTIDSSLDLVLEREIDVPRDKVWRAWTTPELIKEWFCPRPWRVTDCALDLRPGGTFSTVMRGPEGQEFPSAGCFLEVVPQERLVFTDALQPGYRPAEKPFFTGVILLEDAGAGRTRYTAIAIHRDVEARKQHEQMGFHEGWGKALDQLVELAKGM